MRAETLVAQLHQYGCDFFAGVPDSQLKALCDYLTVTYGIGKNHIIAANEGNAAALAAGYHLATGKIPCVYMQNSGLGNVLNPMVSLHHPKVYGIPSMLIVGWRGEPGVKDEPQHVYQGEITLQLLADMGIEAKVLDPSTQEEEIEAFLKTCKDAWKAGKTTAIVVRKGALQSGVKGNYANEHPMTRESVIEELLKHIGDDLIVSTTGKASRELFELRESRKENHSKDFLTVGSMGHASSIALGIAMHAPHRRVWCLDGDGAALMHLGAMPVLASQNPENLIHIILNNQAHETVGGMPTVAGSVNWPQVALACGYRAAFLARTKDDLERALRELVKAKGPVLLEILCAMGARADLGRPTTTPQENKRALMQEIKEL